jgi:site-specific DNA recombinase
VHRYQLTGLLVCGLCGRRLEGHWVNRRPGYRCRHGHTTAQVAEMEGPGWVYWSQTRIVEHVIATGDGDLAGVADAGDLAARLRARDALIVCGPDTIAIEEAVTDDLEPEVQPADYLPATGQARPSDANPVVRAVGRAESGTDQRMPKPRRETTNPHRDQPECE